MVRRQRGRDGKVLQQPFAMACVLSGDQINLLEHGDRTCADVLKVSYRRCDNVERALCFHAILSFQPNPLFQTLRVKRTILLTFALNSPQPIWQPSLGLNNY